MRKKNKITSTLKGAIIREDLSGVQLSKLSGVPYPTLIYRYKHPMTWRFCEWAAISKYLKFNEIELKTIREELNCL